MKFPGNGKKLLIGILLLVTACNLPLIPDQPSTPTLTPAPLDPTIAVTGPIETVYQWSRDRCDFLDWPDMPLRPFRDADGNVQANRSLTTNRRFMGPGLDSIKALCDVTMKSSNDPDPSKYNDLEWFQAFYTEDGQTIHAIVHNEENGNGSYYQNMTYAVSTDGGLTFSQPDPPDQLVATMPLKFEKNLGLYGMTSGSNIVKGKDGFYYMLALRQEISSGDSYICLLRTDTLSEPASWRAWGGSAFDVNFIDPYLEADIDPVKHDCADIAPNFTGDAGMGLGESLIYSTYLNRYITVDLMATRRQGGILWGLGYALSDDLIHWDTKKNLMGIRWGAQTGAGGDDGFGYVVLLDPDSPTRNFETADKTAYIYATRMNHSSGMTWPNMDLVRFPVEFFMSAGEALRADVRTQLDLKRDSSSDRVAFSGRLLKLDDSAVANAPIEIVSMPDDDVGHVYEYTFTGTIPDNVKKADAGLRVNTECGFCREYKADSEMYIYELSYTEPDGANRIQGNRFQNGMSNFFTWGAGQVSVMASDQGEGRMMHVKSVGGQDIGLNSWEFTVTPGAAFTYKVKARVIPGSYDTGFFGLFLIPAQGEEAFRVTIPFFDPPTTIGSATTDANGAFKFDWQNAPSGKYRIKASYAGNGKDWPASDSIQSLVR